MKLSDFVSFCEVSDGQFVVGELFQKKFNGLPPEEQHHLVALYRKNSHHLIPASYVHFRPYGDICLVGGACTDGEAFAYMSKQERELIQQQGGLYYHLLRYAFKRFATQFTAFFGYCGEARALEVDLKAGFKTTEHKYLLIYSAHILEPIIEKSLTAKAAALGPF